LHQSAAVFLCINTAKNYSPWLNSVEVKYGVRVSYPMDHPHFSGQD
jgi:hypothetical protein